MINEVKLDNLLIELGHDDFTRGTEYLREAVRQYAPGLGLTKVIYPAIAAANGSTWQKVERCMRHSIEKAWTRCGDAEVQARYFGNSVDPESCRPQVGEYIARLARLCRATEGDT